MHLSHDLVRVGAFHPARIRSNIGRELVDHLVQDYGKVDANIGSFGKRGFSLGAKHFNVDLGLGESLWLRLLRRTSGDHVYPPISVAWATSLPYSLL